MASCEADLSQSTNAEEELASNTISSFIYPTTEGTAVSIEFCDRCRWLHRATWVQTELFLSFPPPVITSVTLYPRNSEDTAGRFRVWVSFNGDKKLAWDRKSEGSFPELKILVKPEDFFTVFVLKAS